MQKYYSLKKYFLFSIALSLGLRYRLETRPEDSKPIIELLGMPSWLLAWIAGWN